MHVCDLCRAETDYAAPLREIYQTKDVLEVCHSCEKDINDVLWKARGIVPRIVQRFIRQKRESGIFKETPKP